MSETAKQVTEGDISNHPELMERIKQGRELLAWQQGYMQGQRDLLKFVESTLTKFAGQLKDMEVSIEVDTPTTSPMGEDHDG